MKHGTPENNLTLSYSRVVHFTTHIAGSNEAISVLRTDETKVGVPKALLNWLISKSNMIWVDQEKLDVSGSNDFHSNQLDQAFKTIDIHYESEKVRIRWVIIKSYKLINIE